MNVLSYKQLKQIIAYSKNNCKTNGFDHKFDHINLTVKIAQFLAIKEKADMELCTVSAYLHDIAADKFRKKHGVVGAKLARIYLQKIKAPKTFIKKVCYCIAQHNKGSFKKTTEAKILWDADKLQLVGPLGFTRIIRFCVLTGKKIDMFPLVERSEKYEVFFYNRFYTKSGKKLATNVHKFMGKFHSICNNFKTADMGKLYA
ncbi:MAG: hypothetical protein A2252_03035 [Elusimicrobia bacterium RIFOXYA2_FULL_39_19]|nr:MAG: hypothetical protein A2252_03035 [Elusimicrobia bacterium RIFOXYA2_FULL_39_19]